MNAKKLLKVANSKSQLAKAVISYQRALAYYAEESHWAVKSINLTLMLAVGKLLQEQGESFRLAHPELLSAYQSAVEDGEDIIQWLKDDDPTLPAQTVLGMRRPGTGQKPERK